MNDYARIERMIQYLDAHHQEHPSLNDLAKIAGLSASRFHHLFRDWAGVTPKQFLSCLTAEHAKTRLRDSASVLDASLDAGLSGPGRLHDLFVNLEGSTPGEFKRGGEGLVIEWGVVETVFGWCSLGWTERGICSLRFQEKKTPGQNPLSDLWPQAEWRHAEPDAVHLCEQIFGKRPIQSGGLHLWVNGTPFQLQVWRALLQIPEGQLCSYGQLAERIRKPGAARAVGTACGANPIGYLIPCHRVIRETGIVEGYRWGRTRKKAMVAWEGSRF